MRRGKRQGTAGAAACTRPGCERPNTSATVARAQRIRVTAVSGCPPKASATRAVQPRLPWAATAAVIACRTCQALGSSECCSGEANSASARAALMLR